MTNTEENSYIEKVLNGDSVAFAWLVNKYQDMAYTVALRIVRSSEDAEEVAQDSFLKAFKQLSSFEGNSKFSTWLYTIAYRTAISKVQLKKIETVNEDFHLEIAHDESFPQLEELKTKEQAFYVKKAIEQLPEIDGVIISLFYMEESSIQEIVEITGLSESNVKVKLYRGEVYV